MLDAVGWIATAIFSASYFFERPGVLRLIQAAAACLWIVYGVALGALPVVIANVIVAVAALYSVRADRAARASAAMTGFNAQRATSVGGRHPKQIEPRQRPRR
jgi:hypothetical protein